MFNSRGDKSIEVDVISDNQFLGRACAPSGASVGMYEVKVLLITTHKKLLKYLEI